MTPYENKVAILKNLYAPYEDAEYCVGVDVSVVAKETVLTFCVFNKKGNILCVQGQIINNTSIADFEWIQTWIDVIHTYYNRATMLVETNK